MCVLIGKKAPEFSASCVHKGKIIEEFSLSDVSADYIVLFFYPLDFTFVCPTELHAFQKRYQDFQEKGAELIACSTDSHFSHFAWLHTPKNKGGIEGVEYTILSDMTKQISKDYGVLKEDEGVAYRGLFLIDKNRIVRHMLINDLSLGRSVDEALRMLDALICFEKNGEVCPANWHKGEKTIKPTQKGIDEFFS